MYGFHKIPHLQQGVLKSDSDTEPWHFEHSNFRRAQPDLLCLIQRKKQPSHGQAEEPALDVHDPAAAAATPLASAPPGHLMDINSVLNGVAAIKRHQQAISADLSALKQSNDALWKEAIASRQRHAKHQDTINRILKFLAGVFGHAENTNHSSDGTHTPPQVTPRIRQRLMIGGRAPKHVDIVEVEDDEADYMHNKGTTPFSGEDHILGFPGSVVVTDARVDRFAAIPTPETTASTPSVVESIAPSEAFSPGTDTAEEPTNSPPLRPAQYVSHTNTLSSTVPRITNGSPPSSVPTPGALPTIPGQTSADPTVWQAALQQMMNSPGQFQRIVQAFANQQPIPNLAPSSDAAPPNGNHSTVTTYDPAQTNYGQWFNPSVPPSLATAPQPFLPPTHSEENPLHLLLDESNHLQKSYRDANEIDEDMDMLQSSINSLIQNLGIDPTSLAPPEEPISPTTPIAPHTNGMPHVNGYAAPLPPEAFSNAPNGMNGLDVNGSEPVPDYLLDSLLSQIGDSGGGPGGPGLGYADVTNQYDHSARIDGTAIEDASTEQLAAFLDEAHVGVDGSRSPTIPRNTRQNGSGVTHTKRKSDVADLPLPTPPAEETGRKVKRKR